MGYLLYQKRIKKKLKYLMIKLNLKYINQFRYILISIIFKCLINIKIKIYSSSKSSKSLLFPLLFL